MASKTLARTEWHAYFERCGNTLRGKLVRVEIVGAALGDQILVRSSSLLGITYETSSDTLEIIFEGLVHTIEKPRAISVEEANGVPAALEVVDREGQHQIVTLIKS